MLGKRLNSFSEIFQRYDAVFSDVWGVVHNGVESYPSAVAALKSARDAGLVVVLITNSPRVSWQVIEQLRSLGVPDDAYDSIVTSGDVTRATIAKGPRKIFFLGPDLHLPLIDGLPVERVAAEKAEMIVCTGLFNDETETAEDYRDLLAGFRERNLTMVCANPDIVVERGKRLVPCAGALAAAYEALGGKTVVAGKPHRPIYDAVYEAANSLAPGLQMERIVALGDAMVTDVKGALGYGLDLLYVSEGIHAHDYASATGEPDIDKLTSFLQCHGAKPKWWMRHLV